MTFSAVLVPLNSDTLDYLLLCLPTTRIVCLTVVYVWNRVFQCSTFTQVVPNRIYSPGWPMSQKSALVFFPPALKRTSSCG